MSGDQSKADLGVAQLGALAASDMNHPQVQILVVAALDSVARVVGDRIESETDTTIAVDPDVDKGIGSRPPAVDPESPQATEGEPT